MPQQLFKRTDPVGTTKVIKGGENLKGTIDMGQRYPFFDVKPGDKLAAKMEENHEQNRIAEAFGEGRPFGHHPPDTSETSPNNQRRAKAKARLSFRERAFRARRDLENLNLGD